MGIDLDPKMGWYGNVPHVWPYFVGIFPCILNKWPYIWQVPPIEVPEMAIELMLGRKVQRHPRVFSKQQLIPSQEEGQVVQHPILELLASGWKKSWN